MACSQRQPKGDLPVLEPWWRAPVSEAALLACCSLNLTWSSNQPAESAGKGCLAAFQKG